MNIDLSEKVVVVTGSSRGLGSIMVRYLAANSAQTIINYKSNQKAAEELLSEISETNDKCSIVQADVTKEDEVKVLYHTVIEQYGRVDILINNVGVCDDNYIQFMSLEQWNHVLESNLYSTFLCSRLFSKAMIKNGRGKIINIASLKGQIGSEGQCNYSASKAGVIGLTKALAREFGGYNISVNVVCPGFVMTDLNRDNKNKAEYALKMSAMNLEYSLSDLGNFIVYFCSDYVKGISGREFNLDSRIL